MKTRTSLLALLLLSFLPALAYSVDTVTVSTANIPAPAKATVILPDRAVGGTPCPTVYILNGFGGDYRSWTSITDRQLGRLADEYDMILVMPDGMNSWYWDSPVDPKMKMESYFVEDLVPYIDSRFPTVADRSKRAITGLSMGGHGALYLAARHPEIFGNAGSMSGGVDIRPFPKSWKMAQWLGPYEENKEVWDAHTVANLVPQLRDGNINITFDCGKDDFFAEVNNNLHQALLDAGVPHDYASRPGKHTHSYWRNSILYHLLFFNENFNKAAQTK